MNFRKKNLYLYLLSLGVVCMGYLYLNSRRTQIFDFFYGTDYYTPTHSLSKEFKFGNHSLLKSKNYIPTSTNKSTPTFFNQVENMKKITTHPSEQKSIITSIPEGMILVDHRSVELFDDIPANYLEEAKNLRVLFSDRSVGEQISYSLDCLTAQNWADSPSACRTDYYDDEWHFRTFTQDDLELGLVPRRILFQPNPEVYDRSNWTYEYRTGGWSGLTQDFVEGLAPMYLDTKDVLSYQFSYLNVGDNSDIADPEGGFFADNLDKYDVYDLEEFISEHPDKIFIFWTSSLARAIGTQVSEEFNNRMREYAIEHNKILFDVADIEAHTDLGEACYDNRDGIEYCRINGECENYPDDGLDLLAICQDWTTEIDGGHFGNLAGGKIAIAKAFWVLMAQIAGWVP